MPINRSDTPNVPGSNAAPSGGLIQQPIRIVQCGRDLVLGQLRAVIAIDRKRDAARIVDVARPGECLVERGELLEQELVLLKRADRLGAARTDENAKTHDCPPFSIARVESTKGARPNAA